MIKSAKENKVPKTYDYLFILMSNEQFMREFNDRKIKVYKPPKALFEAERHLQY